MSKGLYYNHLLSRTMKPCFRGEKLERQSEGLRSEILVLSRCKGVRLDFGVDHQIRKIRLERKFIFLNQCVS